MRKLLFLVFLAITFNISAQVPANYYDGISGTGYTLKTNLYNLINGHTERTYDQLWTDMQSTDNDGVFENDNTVLDMYSENPTGADPYNYTWVSDQCGTYSGEGSCYNREHSFPKSWFDDATPMYTDLFHLYPTDGYVNGQRSNLPFGENDGEDYLSNNGSKKGTCTYPGYTGTVFEPIDEFKGDFARSYFYMATRYENVISGWIGSDMLDGSSDQCFTTWAVNMLVEWHTNDPVSTKELNRNDAVYDIQGNANPYIDHPEWVDEIWGTPTINPQPDNYPTSFTATANGTSQIDLSWTDATGTNLPDYYLIKANETGTFSDPVDATDPAADSNLSDGSALVKASHGSGGTYSFTGLSGSTTYYFKIWSYTNSGANIDFKTDGTPPTDNATTNAPPENINSEDFANCASSTWTAESVASDADWECDAINYYSIINAYGSSAAADDYLISPQINLDNYTGEIISFESWTQYADTQTPTLELLYSVDYSGNASVATWNSLTATFSAEDSQVWTSSGNVDISTINGSSVYFAFHYQSSGTGNGTSTSWRIDNISITGYSAGATLSASPTSLTGFSYIEGSGPSSEQTVVLSGSDLDGTDVTASAPASGNYEISKTSGTGFTTGNLTYTAYDGSNQTIYVRLAAGLSTGTYNAQDITISGGGASSITVSNSGEVTSAPDPEPDNYPTSFTATANGSSEIDLSWTDATGTNLPDYYLIKANETGTFSEPVDGTDPSQDTDLSDGSAIVKVAHGSKGTHSFTGLTGSTDYYFKIWSYSNSGTSIDFKTDGTPPVGNATTDAASGSGCASDLIISEYIEGSSNNKYIEIYNGTGSSIDLSNYEVRLYSNGETIPSNTQALTGTLTDGAVFTIGHSSGTIYTPDITSAVCFFNGDDALELYNTVTGQAVDIFGCIGEDPGSSWTSTSNSTGEQTLVRNADVTTGITTNPISGFPSLENEWTQYAQDENSYMGSHTMDCGSATDTDSEVTVGAGAEPATIASTIDTNGEEIMVFDFTFTDAGTADGLATIIDDIQITQGNTNAVADWTNAIAGAYLSGTDLATDLSGTVNASNITFASNDMISIADAGNETYTLKIYLNTDLSNITDNDNLEFALSYSDITCDAAGSSFGSGAPESGDANVAVDITAAQLLFVEQPTNTYVDQTMSPDPTIRACDINGNIDIDYSAAIAVSSSGTMTGEPVSGTWLNGTATFSNLIHTDAGTGLTLTASDGNLTDVSSAGFNISEVPVSIYSGSYEDGDETWTIYNAGGTQDWVRSDDGGTYSPGDPGHDGTKYMWFYGWDENADDWIISPAYDFSAHANITMSFWSWMKNTGPNITMKISTDYDGNTANVSTSTWTDLSPTLASTEQDWTYSGDIDLSTYDGEPNIYIAFYYTGTDVDRNWAIDDYNIMGTISSNTDETSVALAPNTQEPTATISSLNDTQVEAQDVFKFKIYDDGATDGLQTNVTQVVIKNANPGNGAVWTDVLQGSRLYNETAASYVTTGTPVITDNDITIPITAGNLTVADGGTVELTLSVYLNTTNITDGEKLQFFIDADNHGFTAVASESSFASAFVSDIISEEFTLDVAATELRFAASEPPASGVVNQNITATANAVDVNGNLDSDATNSVTLSKTSGAGNMTPDNDIQSLVSGTYSWSIQFDSSDDYTISALTTGLSNNSVTSGIISISNIFAYQGFQNPDLPKDNWNYTLPAGDSYESNDANANLTPIDNWSLHMNGGDELRMDEINISNYTNVKFSFIFAADGANSGHDINLQVSYNGGTNWESEVLVAGGYSGATYDFGATNTNNPYHPQNPFILNIDDIQTSFRAKLNTGNTYYIDEVQLEGTLKPLTIVTLNHMGVDENSAIINSEIENDGGQTITERGIIYCEDPAPATFEIGETGVTKIAEGNSAIGYYTVNISGLTLGTTYHTRAYVITNTETTYGSAISFTTCDGTEDCLNNTDLLISEYIESSGGGTNNAMELYNGTGSDVNLKYYTLRFDNGSSGWNIYDPAHHFDLEDYVLPNGNTYVLAYSTATAPELDLIANGGQANIHINLAIGGDEQIQLLKNDTPIDHVGWEANFGEATTFARRPDITSPLLRTDLGDPSDKSCDPNTNGEWIVYPDNYYDDIGNYRDPFTWTGTTSSDWFNTNNWNLVRTPSYSSSVIVGAAATNMPIIDDPLSNGDEAGVYDLTIESGADVSIATSGKMTIQNQVTLSSADQFTIKSDDIGTGSLILKGSGFEATVERYVQANQWHYMCSPLTQIPVSTYTVGGNTNLFSYNEANADYWNTTTVYGTTGWTSEAGNTYLPTNKGYLFNRYTLPATTLTQSGGILQTSDKTYTIAYNVSGTGAVNQDGVTQDWTYFDGWNLVGNPFTSAIDWDAVTKTDVEAGMYCYDDVQGKYQYYISGGGDSPWDIGLTVNNASSIIPGGQGFMVKANSGGGTLTIPEAARVHSSQAFWKNEKTAPNIIRLEIEKDGYTDETLIRTLPDESGVTDAHDGNYDAYKMFSWDNTKPQLYSRTADGSSIFAINSLTEISGHRIVPLSLYIGETGDYQINLTENNFENMHLWIEDLHTETNINLLNQNSFTFSQAAEDNSNRFLLHFGKNTRPALLSSLQDYETAVDEKFKLIIPNYIFYDNDFEDELSYTAFLSDGNAWPDWLTFNANILTFSGIPQEVGEYNIVVRATDTFGEFVEDKFILTVKAATGINTMPNPNIRVFPNPTTGIIFINLGVANRALIQISGISGKILKQFNASGKTIETDISQLAEGVYFIEITTETRTVKKKIILK
ncbi:MAG: endonuclease [Bacteroidota bacterium]|nr:endonuclease [Bacteroidota bacterium]